MAQKLTLQDAQQSLTGHIADKAEAIREKYGPHFGWEQMHRLLEDRDYVRYPCKLVFNEAPLRSGELAHPVARGATPEEGFDLHVHPFFVTQSEVVPAIVLYQLVLVNYGDFASPDDAEVFGSIVLGIPREEYYDQLCEVADLISPGVSTMDPQLLAEPPGCSGGCHSGGGCGGS